MLGKPEFYYIMGVTLGSISQVEKHVEKINWKIFSFHNMLYKFKNVYCVITADSRLNLCVRGSTATAPPNLNPVKHPETPARKSGGTIICPRDNQYSCRVKDPCVRAKLSLHVGLVARNEPGFLRHNDDNLTPQFALESLGIHFRPVPDTERLIGGKQAKMPGKEEKVELLFTV